MKIPTHEKNPWLKKNLQRGLDEEPKGGGSYGFGRAMLAKFGWQLGDGLGRDPKKGLKSSLDVEQKDDRRGVGKTREENRYNWEEKWWEGTFERAAEKFAVALVKTKKKNGRNKEAIMSSESESDSDSDSEDDEFERRVRESALTTEEEKEQIGNDGMKHSGCKKELDVAKRIAKETCSFRGRKGKLKRIASFEEAQMKTLLRASERETIMNTNLEVRERKKKKEEGEETEDDVKNNNKKKKRKKEEKKNGEAYEGRPSETTKRFSWWRNAGFLWGGLVGSKRELDRDIDDDNDKEKKGFTEDKQEDIFNKAHQLASAKGSKSGLGDKAKLGKEFVGTKKSFDNEDKKKKKKEKKEKKDKKKRKSKDGDDEEKKSSKKSKSKK